MPGEFDASAHRQLGELIAGLKSVQETVRRIEDGAARSETKSDAIRAQIHRRMDDLVDRVGDVEASVDTVKNDVKDMKPVTDAVKIWRQRGVGALAIVGIGASFITYVVTKFSSDVFSWLAQKY